MTSLFRKLNTLVNAKVHGVLDDAMRGTVGRVSSGPSAKKLDQQVKKLRERIDAAIVYEEQQEGRIAALRDEVARLDQQADDAVKRGDEDTARRLIAQMQNVQRRLEMGEADLREHQLLAQDLMQQVSNLETAVTAAQQAEQAQSGVKTDSTGQPMPVPSSETVMDKAQAKIGELGELLGAKKDNLSAFVEQKSPAETRAEIEAAVNEVAVDDELEARRKRLSK